MFSQDLAQPFERVMACTPAELLSWLPAALPSASLTTEGERQVCTASFDDGDLRIEWQVLEPRRIALLRLPQLRVRFCYAALSNERRIEIQRNFDRATQRGGG